MHRSLVALVSTFGKIYDDRGDAEVHSIAALLTKYKVVCSCYAAKLQGNLLS